MVLDTQSTLWLPFHVIDFFTEKEIAQQFAKAQETGVNRHQHAIQVMSMKINFLLISFTLLLTLLHILQYYMSHFSYLCKTERENGISQLISELCLNSAYPELLLKGLSF